MKTYDGGTFLPESYERASMYIQYINALELFANLSVFPGMNCLDIGCGTGLFSEFLAGFVSEKGQVVGIDISSEMIDYARERRASVDNVVYAVADARDLAALSLVVSCSGDFGGFDIAFSNFVFHWLRDEEELARTLSGIVQFVANRGQIALRFSSDGTFRELFEVAYAIASENRWRKIFGDDFEHPGLPMRDVVQNGSNSISGCVFDISEQVSFRRFGEEQDLANWFRACVRPFMNPLDLVHATLGAEFSRLVAETYFAEMRNGKLGLGDAGVLVRDQYIQVLGRKVV